MDEITSALDPTITIQVLGLVSDYKKQQGTSIIFITHDLSVAMEICDRIAVMQKGRIVETGKANEIIDKPSHPYTMQLISGIFQKTGKISENSKDTLISTKNLSVKFSLGSGKFLSRRSFYAVKNVTLDIRQKEIFCLIGESGSGKTTLMNGILGFCSYQEGEIIFDKQPAGHPGDPVHQRLKKQSQVVFQDPISSLNPYLSLKQSIIEPLLVRGINKKEGEKTAYRLAAETGLPDFILEKKPGKVSVGQNQRACIARALSTRPDILFLDEPLSALDAVNRKEISELLFRLKESHGLTCFLITHDLGLVRNIGTTVAVMYLGRIVEKAPVKDFFSGAYHPYSQALLTNALNSELNEKNRIIIKGDIPSPHDPPSGCVFHPRCPKRLPMCEEKAPSKIKINKHHEVFCHLYQSGSRDIYKC
jgi:oligopeptide/dipeptide ABC transporter ATP-binding protein